MATYGPLLLSFILSTFVGGIFGAVIQQRSWRHKTAVESLERNRKEASDTFESVSVLMDKRLYRLHQLCIWTARKQRESFEKSLDDYREVVFEWNDHVNRIMAKIQIYLGKEIREKYEHDIGKKFVDVGAELELIVRTRLNDTEFSAAQDTSNIASKIDKLRLDLIDFNLEMLEEIEAKRGDEEQPSLFQELSILCFGKARI